MGWKEIVSEFAHRTTGGLLGEANTHTSDNLGSGANDLSTIPHPDSSRRVTLDSGASCTVTRPINVAFSSRIVPVDNLVVTHSANVASRVDGSEVTIKAEDRAGKMELSESSKAAGEKLRELGIECRSADGQPVSPALTPSDVRDIGSRQAAVR